MARRDQGPPLPQVRKALWEVRPHSFAALLECTACLYLAAQVSAETQREWARELAAKVQKRVDRTSKHAEWASRLEAAAMQPLVRRSACLADTGSLPCARHASAAVW